METNQNRQGETGVTPFRSGRFFAITNRWYFSTREGIDKGPYTSKSEAIHALTDFLDHCKKLNTLFH